MYSNFYEWEKSIHVIDKLCVWSLTIHPVLTLVDIDLIVGVTWNELKVDWQIFLIFSEPFLSIIIALYSVIVLCGGGSRNNISDFNQKYFCQFSETSWWCSPLSSPRRWGPRGMSSSSVSPSRTSCSPSPSPPPSTTPSPRPGRCPPTPTFAGQNTGDKD